MQVPGEGGAHGPELGVYGFPQVNPDTGYINYDQLEENARLFHPKLIIAGDERAESSGGSSQSLASCKVETGCCSSPHPGSLLVSALDA